MKTLSILSIGNSFSADTMEFLAPIALRAGYERVFMCNLYIGGCSVRKHLHNAQNGIAYPCFTDDGTGWTQTDSADIAQTVESRDWDVINIQQGTLDGSCYSKLSDYDDLPALIAFVRAHANEHARITFNMTWVGEPDFDHHEIKAYGGDTQKLFEDILSLTKNHIAPLEGLDAVSPTGLAIQLARAEYDGKLTCDGYHLSKGIGRFAAALTFLQAVTKTRINKLDWSPENVNETEKTIALSCAKQALAIWGGM